MKILSFNTGYFLDYDGTHLDYLRNPLKSVRGSGREKENLKEFAELVEKEDPEFVLVQEIDGGSYRTSTDAQYRYLEDRLPEKYSKDFHKKYRGVIFPRIPIFRHMGNAVFYTQGKVRDHSLSIGRKNLVQEIRLEDFSIFSIHLSTFGGWIRRRQLHQVKEIAEKRKEYVLAGDLNFHKGQKEIDHLEKILDNEVHSPGKTFPAGKPAQRLDLVTSSKGLEIKNLEGLGDRFSDHRPIKFEVEQK